MAVAAPGKTRANAAGNRTGLTPAAVTRLERRITRFQEAMTDEVNTFCAELRGEVAKWAAPGGAAAGTARDGGGRHAGG